MGGRWLRLATSLLAVLLATSVVGGPVRVASAVGGVDEAIEQALPPGARHLLAAVRVFEGLSARNRVYREAKRVQRDLRAYYDARIETAQQMLLDREHLGLADTQVAAYGKVKTMLEAEREAALQLTENEKRAAKYAFEGKLRRELFSALLRTPKAQTALKGVRDTLKDVRDGFGKLQAALEGGNPVAVFVEDLQDKVDKIRAAGQVMTMLSGNAGAQIIAKADAVQSLIDDANSATALASEANGKFVGALDGAIDTLGSHIKTKRRPRAAGDMLAGLLADEIAERIFTPGGEVPVEDIVADVIARGFDPSLVQNIGVALDEIDPMTLATMRERVRAQLLADKLDRIATECGRLTGSGRSETVAAVAGDTPAPETRPCALFRNPEALQRFITKMIRRPETTPAGAQPGPFDGVYSDREPGPPRGSVVEVLDSNLSVEVIDNVVGGSWTTLSITAYTTEGEDWAYIKIQEATGVKEFVGLVDETGAFEAEGTTRASYVLLSCEPIKGEDPCLGVSATRSARPDGVPISVSGTIEGPVLEARMVNSVSGWEDAIEAYKEAAP